MQTAQQHVPITAHVPLDLHRGPASLARENDRSLSAEIRRALAEHLERERARASS
jgi:predicted transcriptional regulator